METAGNSLQAQVQVETQRLQSLQDQVRTAADTRIAALEMSVARGETAVATWNTMIQTMEARITSYNDNLNQTSGMNSKLSGRRSPNWKQTETS